MAAIVDTFTNRVTAKFDSPLYGGGSTSTSLVPGKFPVAIDGRGYMLDLQVEHTFTDYWRHESIPLVRTQADTGTTPAEASINPEGLWRRAADSWHMGAGATYRDRDPKTDDDFKWRFRSSKGIDPWTRYQMGLLPDTANKLSSANTNLALVSAGARLYVADGTALKYTTDITAGSPTFTTVTGTSGSSITSICSDGFTVYIADGANIYTTNTGTGAAASYCALACTLVAYTKGRVMAANANSVYNVTSGTPPAALFSHANTNFAWVGFTEGANGIYAAGYSGDKSLIYRFDIKPDASTLDQPVIAGELPDGEIVRSIQGYLGNIVIGTDLGFRFATTDGSGNLNIGTLITTTSAVKCFEPQDRFIWFGWTNYDSTSTGLGRLDISQFTDQTDTSALTPAYASDLMATVQGTVLSVASFQSQRVFAVSGSGFWTQTANKVASGVLKTGTISFGVPDDKVSLYVDTHMLSFPAGATFGVALATDGGTFNSLSTAATVGANESVQFSTEQTRGGEFELQYTLTRGTDTTTGPTLNRWTFKAFPTTNDGTGEVLQVPVLLAPRVAFGPFEQEYNVDYELGIFKGLRATRKVINYQELTTSYTGYVEDYHWVPYHIFFDEQWRVSGTLIMQFKRIA